MWVHEDATGLLLEKQYADHAQQDPRNTEYTYENDGRLKQRSWSRSQGQGRLVTEYSYGTAPGSSPADLIEIEYSDGTPGVEFTYNRLGRIATVTDAVGIRIFTYDPGGLHLLSEELISIYYNNKLITRKYDSAAGVVGRVTGFQVGTFGSPDQYYDTTYTYDALGRLEKVFGPGLDSTHGVAYTRLEESSANTSDMVEHVAFKSDTNDTLAGSQRLPVSSRDLLDYVENKVDTTTISKYDYYLDTLGRREAVVHTGSAFTSHLLNYTYNDRSELTVADRREGTDPSSPGNPTAAPHDWDYVYDPIGNRDTFTLDGGTATTYADNSVNQYTATTGGQSASFGYDFDGNLTSDDAFAYVWDGENRLSRIVTKREGQPQAGDRKLDYAYDYMSRRVEKKYSVHNGSDWVVQSIQRFVYDQWNVVLVLDGTDGNAVQTKYTWGLDMSGLAGDATAQGIHGAGGIGGLLAAVETGGANAGTYWFLYDGNGNVGQVLDATDTQSIAVAARYEYDPFGRLIVTAGDYADANPFRASPDVEAAGSPSWRSRDACWRTHGRC